MTRIQDRIFQRVERNVINFLVTKCAFSCKLELKFGILIIVIVMMMLV